MPRGRRRAFRAQNPGYVASYPSPVRGLERHSESCRGRDLRLDRPDRRMHPVAAGHLRVEHQHVGILPKQEIARGDRQRGAMPDHETAGDRKSQCKSAETYEICRPDRTVQRNRQRLAPDALPRRKNICIAVRYRLICLVAHRPRSCGGNVSRRVVEQEVSTGVLRPAGELDTIRQSQCRSNTDRSCRQIRSENVVTLDVRLRDGVGIPDEGSANDRRWLPLDDPPLLANHERRRSAERSHNVPISCVIDSGVPAEISAAQKHCGKPDLESGSSKRPYVLELGAEETERWGLSDGEQGVSRVPPKESDLRCQALPEEAPVETHFRFCGGLGTEQRIADAQGKKARPAVEAAGRPGSLRVEAARCTARVPVRGAQLHPAQRGRPELLVGDHVRRTDARIRLKSKIFTECTVAVEPQSGGEKQPVRKIENDLRECTPGLAAATILERKRESTGAERRHARSRERLCVSRDTAHIRCNRLPAPRNGSPEAPALEQRRFPEVVGRDSRRPPTLTRKNSQRRENEAEGTQRSHLAFRAVVPDRHCM